MKEQLKQVVEDLQWLETHNKNYTKKQYFLIQDIKDRLEKILMREIAETEKEITIVCYGEIETMQKSKALKLYKEALRGSDGHEKQRYANIFADLNDGRELCWDGEEDEIPNGYHVCQYCGSLTYGNDTDRLCVDCQMTFGHSTIDEL